MPDERIKLLLDLGMSAQEVEKVVVALDKLGTSASKTADTYKVLNTVVEKGTTAMATYAISTDKVDTALDKLVADAVEQTRAQKAMNLVLEEFNTVAVAAAGDKRPGGRGMLGLSYAFQDFTTVLAMGGGLPRALMSISNNIDQLAISLGASVTNAAKLSLGFTAFATALPILTPLFKTLWDQMAGGEEGRKGLEEGLDTLEKRIDKMAEKLAGIRKGMETTSPEKTMEEFFALQGKGDTAEEKARDFIGKVASARVEAGRGEKMTPAEVEAISDEAVEKYVGLVRTRAVLGGEEFDEAKVRAEARQVQQEAREAAEKRVHEANVAAAAALVEKAKAEPGAQATLLELGRRAPGTLGARFAEHMETVMPAALRRGEQEDIADEAKERRIHEGLEKRDKDAAELRKADERTKQLIANTERNAARRDRQALQGELRVARPPEGGIRGMIKRQEQEVQGRQAQQQVFEATGEVVPPDRAMAIVKQRQRELMRQENEFLGNVMDFADGMGQEAAMWAQANKEFRQMQQPKRDGGKFGG